MSARGTSPPGLIRYTVTTGAWIVGLFGVTRLEWTNSHVLIPLARLQQLVADQLTGATPGRVIVDASCSGGDAMALCLGAMLAFPAPWRARLHGGAFGLLLITGLNTVRIGHLSLVADDPSRFTLLHVYLWPAILILAAVAYVYAWMSRQGSGGARTARRLGGPVRGHAQRFFLLTVLLGAGYFAAASRLYESDLLQTLGAWVATTGGGMLGALGVSATVSGRVVQTAHGGFMVTQECIATPLIPVYLAAVLSVPLAPWRRAAGLLAAAPLFFLLGVSRLLALALPGGLVASHAVAIHAFSQGLVAVMLVPLVAIWVDTTSPRRRGPARHAMQAVGVGLVAALAAGPVWSRLIGGAVTGVQAVVQHGGHAYVDPQGAVVILPAFQLGLFAALWLASGAPGPWRRAARGVALLAGLQLGAILSLGELSHHVGLALHVSLIRAWALAAPLGLVWALRQPTLRAGLVPAPSHPLPHPGE